jgi:hypothetical protein
MNAWAGTGGGVLRLPRKSFATSTAKKTRSKSFGDVVLQQALVMKPPLEMVHGNDAADFGVVAEVVH